VLGLAVALLAGKETAAGDYQEEPMGGRRVA
jgi:hypothetical protein